MRTVTLLLRGALTAGGAAVGGFVIAHIEPDPARLVADIPINATAEEVGRQLDTDLRVEPNPIWLPRLQPRGNLGKATLYVFVPGEKKPRFQAPVVSGKVRKMIPIPTDNPPGNVMFPRVAMNTPVHQFAAAFSAYDLRILDRNLYSRSVDVTRNRRYKDFTGRFVFVDLYFFRAYRAVIEMKEGRVTSVSGRYLGWGEK